MRVDLATQQDVKAIVDRLFADGKSPLGRYGIDPEKLDRIEKRNPQITKMGVPLTHPLDRGAVG